MRLYDMFDSYTEPLRGADTPSSGFEGMDIPDSGESSATAMIVADMSGTLGQIDREVLRYVQSRCSAAVMTFILNRTEEAVVAVDAEGRVFFANQGGARLLDAPVDGLLGKNIQEPELGAAVAQTLERRMPVAQNTLRIHTANRYVSLRVLPLVIKGRFEGAVAIFTDATKKTAVVNSDKKPDRTTPPRTAVRNTEEEGDEIVPLQDAMREYERKLLIDAMRRYHNNKGEAMRALGMTRRTFYRKLAAHRLNGRGDVAGI